MTTWRLALVVTLLLAAASALGQPASAPPIPDPCRVAPNLPYCP